MNRRIVGLIIGGVVVVVGLFIIVGEQMAGVSADAVINAQVLVLRAPVDGEITMQVRTLGTRVSPDEPLATISDPRPDDTRLVDLQRELRRVAIDLERLQSLADKLAPIREAFAKQAGDYATGRVSQLETRLTEGIATLDGVQARLRDTDSIARRAAELGRSGTVSGAEQSRSRAALEVGTQDLQVARQRVAYLKIELDAARGGTFLGDSYNDTPYSQQRLRETEQRLSEYKTEIRERDERLVALKDQVSEERVRAARFREARIASPTTGILWELMTGSGEYVRRAQDVVCEQRPARSRRRAVGAAAAPGQDRRRGDVGARHQWPVDAHRRLHDHGGNGQCPRIAVQPPACRRPGAVQAAGRRQDL